MKEQWAKLNDWFTQLEQRERRLVSVGAVAVIFAAIYFLFWSPMTDSVDAMRRQIKGQQKTLAWMKSVDAALKKTASGAQQTSVMSPVELLSYLQKAIKRDGLQESLTQLKQSSNNAIHMQFKDVSFDRLMKTLIGVLGRQNVTISQFNAVAVNQPGLVDADMILKLN